MPARTFLGGGRSLARGLGPGLGLTGPIPRETPYEDTGGPFYLDPEGRRPDPIEDDLARVVVAAGGLDNAALTAMCERAIRNYDPCISCSTHFLTLTVNRR